jgi:elongation factor P--beta-lysine ligase
VIRIVKTTISISLLLGLLIRCGFVEQKEYAENCVHKHFVERERGAIEQSAEYYGEAFWKKTSRAEWVRLLSTVQVKLGKPTSYVLTNWNTRQAALSKHGTSGAYVTLTYAVKYERGKGTETFEVFRPAGKDDVAIVSHVILSNDLVSK